MRISDWSSDVCSSDLAQATREALALAVRRLGAVRALAAPTVTADFFDSLEVVEQAGWTQNFLQRCTYDFTANSGYVTLLDGQTWLPEVGMWYYKARIYSPTLGRFMQTDPLGYAGHRPRFCRRTR